MATEHLAVDQQVYYYDEKNGWHRAVIVQITGDKVVIQNHETQQLATIPATDIHGYIAESYEASDPDLFHVSDLHVATLLYCIKDRFEQLRMQYSMMGEMVLSVNPFQLMPFNSVEERKKYLSLTNPRGLPPHIWQVAHKAFNAIFLHGLNNQSVVISGESGSGKTESTKMLIAYLGQVSYMRSQSSSERSAADRIDESLTFSNPVMESFGNARTVRNDNSSRFGKYIKLYFDTATGVMIGGETVTYLLERSRIILQSEGERNFHIFYEMLAGLSAAEKHALGNLKSATDYKCLNGGNTFTRRGVDGHLLNDAEEFHSVREAMQRIGIGKEVEDCIFRILASILHLMEVPFAADNNDKACLIDEEGLETACKLLRLSPAKLKKCFLVKSETAVVSIQSSPSEAENFRNAFCKAMYVSVFDKIVDFVNHSIAPQPNHNPCKYIGLLDIFGFEKFHRNSFEQLCINYANEALQNHYNKYTFLNDEEDCKREGIPTPTIVFTDNSECVKMFDEKPNGVFAMLDEECHFKGGSTAHFTANLWDQWRNRNKYFVQPKSTIPNQFGINHYAAFVQYNTDEWLEKNTDALKPDMYDTLASSSDSFVSSLLCSERSQARRQQTVAIRFQKQLTELRSELESTETQFIRCIKPNSDASPLHLDNHIVGFQLESAGVLQTIALKRQGYPVRRSFIQFCRYFYLIMPHSTVAYFKQGAIPKACQDFLNYYQCLYKWDKPNFAVGRTKVLMRSEVWSSLERLVLRRNRQLRKRCRPYLARWIAEFRERKRIEEEKRLAELRRLRIEREAKAAALAEGLLTTKALWAADLASLFPDIVMDLILDIAAEADSYHEALVATLAIQEQIVDREAPSALMELMCTAKVRAAVIGNFIEGDIKSSNAVARLKPADLKVYGCSDVEVVAITNYIIDQQSQRSQYERLKDAVGSSSEEGALEAVRTAAATRHVENFEVKVRAFVAMGFPEADVRLVLAHYDGDSQRTAARLLYSGVNHDAIRKNAKKHPEHTTFDPMVQRLISMGATKQDAKMALRKAQGNADEAARILFRVS